MCSFCWLVTQIILSKPKEIHSVHLREVFLSIGQIFRHIYLFSTVNITSAGSSLQFQKYQLSKQLFCNSESARHQQRHNSLAYMMYIYSILSLQCIIGRFSKIAVFGCFVSGERLCCSVFDQISRDKSKSGPEQLLFSV